MNEIYTSEACHGYFYLRKKTKKSHKTAKIFSWLAFVVLIFIGSSKPMTDTAEWVMLLTAIIAAIIMAATAKKIE